MKGKTKYVTKHHFTCLPSKPLCLVGFWTALASIASFSNFLASWERGTSKMIKNTSDLGPIEMPIDVQKIWMTMLVMNGKPLSVIDTGDWFMGDSSSAVDLVKFPFSCE